MRLIDTDKIIWAESAFGTQDEQWLSESEVKSYIDSQPTVEAEPIRHGHWIKMQFSNANFQCTCSVCGGKAIHPQFQWYKENIYPYCPNCGARMDRTCDKEGK